MSTPAKKPYARKLGATAKKRPHVMNKRVPLVNQVLQRNGKYTVPKKAVPMPALPTASKVAVVYEMEGVTAETQKPQAPNRQAPAAPHPARAAWDEYRKCEVADGHHTTDEGGEKVEWTVRPSWDELTDGEKVEWVKIVDAALSVSVNDALAHAVAEVRKWKADYEEKARAYAAVYEELISLKGKVGMVK